MLPIHKQKIEQKCTDILNLRKDAYISFAIYALLVITGWVFIFKHYSEWYLLAVLIGQVVFFRSYYKDSRKADLFERELFEIYHFDFRQFLRTYNSKLKKRIWDKHKN